MERFTGLEDAIEQALRYARQNDYDRVILCLAYALTQTSRARQGSGRAPFVDTRVVPDAKPPEETRSRIRWDIVRS